MVQRVIPYLVLLVAPILMPPEAAAQTADLYECQRIKEQIEHYTRLRRRGGDAVEMEEWKQERKRYEELFRRYECRKYEKQLRGST